VPAAFIFNADESGFQDFGDAREVQVIVAVDFDHDSISVPSNRSEKRATMLVAVSADGCSLKPMIIIQRKTYEVDLFESGFTLQYPVGQLFMGGNSVLSASRRPS
jgi:hypothetical protein